MDEETGGQKNCLSQVRIRIQIFTNGIGFEPQEWLTQLMAVNSLLFIPNGPLNKNKKNFSLYLVIIKDQRTKQLVYQVVDPMKTNI